LRMILDMNRLRGNIHRDVAHTLKFPNCPSMGCWQCS
jgi:hypothetical protein